MTDDERPACIGWAADPPCPEHGIMHGCIFYAHHTGLCECRCGHTTQKPTTSHSHKRAS